MESFNVNLDCQVPRLKSKGSNYEITCNLLPIYSYLYQQIRLCFAYPSPYLLTYSGGALRES